MDPLLLEYYNKELLYLKEMGAEFAQQHPKIARRLGMHGIEVADPYDERLLEGFAFLPARTQIKLDAEFPRFTQRLLEVVYPNYLAPTPSMTVVQFRPQPSDGDLSKGFKVARGTHLHSRVHGEGDTEVTFTTSQDVTLWPLSIESARLMSTPPDIKHLERLIPNQRVRGALRLTLKINNGLTFDKLKGLDRLPIYLSGDEKIASQLFELIHSQTAATVICPINNIQAPLSIHSSGVSYEGLRPEQSLLPMMWNSFHGHNLLHEYFSLPSRFYFFELTDLQNSFSQCSGNSVEIILLLKNVPEALSHHVDAQQFGLHCSPAVNLFEKQADRIEVDRKQAEFHLVMNRQRAQDYEVYRVTNVVAQNDKQSQTTVFRPLFETIVNDTDNYGKYYSINREVRLVSESARKYGTRTQYIGTECYISLVDQHEAPIADDIRYLTVTALSTNRDLASLLTRTGKSDLHCKLSIPCKEIGIVRPISPTRPPFAQRERAWRLIRLLSFNYIPLTDISSADSAQALRNLLGLFVAHQDEQSRGQIRALLSTELNTVNRRLPRSGPIVYGRGIECKINVDEDGFSGASPFLFGLILEHFIAKHASINVFTQLSLSSSQRGHIHTFTPRMGQRTQI